MLQLNPVSRAVLILAGFVFCSLLSSLTAPQERSGHSRCTFGCPGRHFIVEANCPLTDLKYEVTVQTWSLLTLTNILIYSVEKSVDSRRTF